MEQTELTKVESEILDALKAKFGDKITGHSKFAGQLSVYADRDIIFDLAEYMKEDDQAGFDLLSDICGVDWIDCPEMRFELVYNFYSIGKNTRILIKTTVPDSDEPSIRSIEPIYSGANWLEREVYDMLGVTFEGHPDLRRIITPDGMEGYPHRKDFPLTYEAPRFTHNKNLPPEIIK